MSSADNASETETRILEAAHRVFLRSGTAGARTQEIADEAGVNKALLHYYFRSKEKLAEAVFVRAARMLFPRMLQTFASDLPIREKLQHAVAAELDMLEENPYIPGYLISEAQYRPDRLRNLLDKTLPLDEMRQAVLGTMQRQLDAEAAAGRLRPARADDVIITLISQLVFPFAAAPILNVMIGLDDDARRAMMARRRDDLVDNLLRTLAP